MKPLVILPVLIFCAWQMFAQVEPIARDTLNLFTKNKHKTPATASVENKIYFEYIHQFKKVATSEMHRTGIPASITLAQAILESGGGESEVAKQANNHFGIKCGANWAGKTYKKLDDDKNADNDPVKSCFRKYGKAEESFYDHSEFLCDPAKSARYGFLFHLDKTDYKAWARGLESAGYASSNVYAEKLIDLIERYSLFQYDRAETQAADSTSTGAASRVGYVNRVQMVFLRANEQLEDIARMFHLDIRELIEYNDLHDSSGVPLHPNTHIFIQEKQKKWHGRLSHHVMQEGQTIFDVSQWYGIKLDTLLKRNGLKPKEEPPAGTQVRLRGRSILGSLGLFQSPK